LEFNLKSLGDYNFYFDFIDTIKPNKLKNKLNEYKNLKKDKLLELHTKGKSIELISYELYNSTDYWFLLLYLNDLINPYFLPDQIFVFSKKDLSIILS